ncbi:MAG: extracellular solute-binding protein, partial [Caldilineaceae bacterium]|nr:extracellular solute-binding protein [Caldilineaceae bacterium]
MTVWADEQRAPVLLPLGDKFKADTGVCLELVQKQFGSIRDDLKVAGPAGEGPDILIGAHDWIGELVNSGLLAEVSLGDKTDSFVPEGVAACNFDSKLYCLPYAVENVGFFINPDLVPEAPATWDDVKTLSKEIKDAGTKYGYLIQENDPYHFNPIQTAFGGYVFGKDANGNWDPTDVGIGSDGTVAAFEWLDSMYADGLLDRGAAINYDLMSAAFQNGDAAMIIGGPWMLDGFRSAGVPYQVVPLPEGPAGQAKPFLGVQGFMINPFSDNVLLAQAFLTEFVATQDVMQKLYETGLRPSAYIPVLETTDDPDLRAMGLAGA